MALFMRDRVLTGDATSMRLITVPDGFDEVRVPQFVEDPLGPIVIERDEGTVRGRYDDRVVLVPRKRIVSVEFDEPQGQGQGQGGGPPSSPGSQGGQ